jgi:hypothetical protein
LAGRHGDERGQTMTRRTAGLLTWLAAAMALAAIGYAALFVVTAVQARRVENRLRANGRPMRAEEVIPPPVPDGENAAMLYNAAFLRLRAAPADGGSLMDRLRTLTAAKDRVATNAELRVLLGSDAVRVAMDLVAEGTARPRCRFDVNYGDGAGAKLPHVTELMTVSRIVAARARVAAQSGDAQAAWRDALTGLRFASAMRDEPLLISQLVRCAQFGIAFDTIAALASMQPPAGSVPAELRSAAAAFDDAGAYVRSLDGERVLMGEWAFALPRRELRRTVAMGTGADRIQRMIVVSTFLQVLLQADRTAYLRFMDQATREAAMPYAPAKADGARTSIERAPWFNPITCLIVPALNQAQKQFVAMAARARVLDCGLALLQYRRARGEFPARLADADARRSRDPFSDGELVCRIEPRGFTIYSVGPNQHDDGGRCDTARPSSSATNADDIAWCFAVP